MPTFHHDSFDSYSGFLTALDHYAEAGIVSAFDDECEELERQFAELRLTFTHN
jgi:hypothetical protein